EIGIAGGADAPITEHGVASFVASGLSSAFRNGDPQKASRPFDRQRISGVLSEGAGIVVLENLERAQARGAKIYVELGGFGTQRVVPPANCEGPDPGCDVKLVTLRPRKARINRALINVRGLGGSASSFVISRFL